MNYKAIHNSADNKEVEYILIQNEPEGLHMPVEMNKSSSVRLTPVQEIKLAKPATELYVGQILKSVVVTALTNNQVLININGQNLNARSSQQFLPGDLLDVKVIANGDETVLEIQQTSSSPSILQSALLQALPKQAPATNLFHTLNQLLNSSKLPDPVHQQIKALLHSITPLSQLPQQLMQAINRSGVFLESELLKWQREMSHFGLKSDFKGQCLKLLQTLSGLKNTNTLPAELKSILLAKDPLPLPGAIPQPLHKDVLLSLLDQSPETIQHILREQVTQVLARITASQINHLSHDNNEGFLIMLDLPIKLVDGMDVIPLMIKQHKAEPMQPSRWSISFALSLKTLGDIQTTVSLCANKIDIKFNAEQSSTINTLNQHQAEMNQILNTLGLKLREWNVQLGLENNHIDVKNLNLLDIRI